jgi:dTDP-4-amino-4,6-dideoxygalactose transaminase
LLDLKAHHEPIRGEILAALERVLDSNRFILGPDVQKFEEEIAAYSNTRFGVGVASGTDALLIALMALDIRPGDEVITTPFSFFSTAGAISRLGARPVFADIELDTYNIDPEKLEAAITKKTRAIIPVHLYGQCADMGPILDIARRHKLYVVEDAAQAIGTEYKDGRRAGSMGTVGCFSFFPSKNLGALGDAGMVVTNDPELAEKLRILRVNGSKPKYYHKYVGGNFRIDALHAAVLSVKLRYLDAWTRKRQEHARIYDSALGDIARLTTPRPVYASSGAGHYHIYNQYVIRTPERDPLRDHLAKAGIETEIYYPLPFHLQECFANLGHRQGDFPLSEQAAKETLAIPVHPDLQEAQQDHVMETIQAFFQKGEPAKTAGQAIKTKERV